MCTAGYSLKSGQQSCEGEHACRRPLAPATPLEQRDPAASPGHACCVLQLCLCCVAKQCVCAGVVRGGLLPLAPAVCALLPTAPCLPVPRSAAEGCWGPEGHWEGLRRGCGFGWQRDPRMGCPCEGPAVMSMGGAGALGLAGGGEQDCTVGALKGEAKPLPPAAGLGH